jgi:hypothetical protein
VASGDDLLVTDAQLQKLAASCAPDGLAKDLRSIKTMGSRAVGSPGLPKVLDWTEQRLREMGFEIWKRQPFTVTVPRDVGSTLECQTASGTFTVPVYACWPNGITPPFVPPEGLTAPLVDGGNGTLMEVDGKPVAGNDQRSGSIVMMDFESGSRWEDMAAIGAGAALFLPSAEPSFSESLSKSSQMPIQFPRFYVDSEQDAQRLRAAADDGATATLRGGMTWAREQTENLVAFLPATATAADGDVETILICLNADAAALIPGIAHGGQSAANLAAGLAALEMLADDELAIPRTHNVLVVIDSARSMATAGLRTFAGILRDINATRRVDWATIDAPTPRQVFLIKQMNDIEPWMSVREHELEVQIDRLSAAAEWMEAAEMGPGPFTFTDARPIERSEVIPHTDAGRWFHTWLLDRVKEQQIATLSEVVQAERKAGIDAFSADSEAPADVLILRRRSRYYQLLSRAEEPQALVRLMTQNPLAAELVGPADVTIERLQTELRERHDELASQQSQLESWTALRQKLAAIDVTRGFVLDISPGSSILTLTRSDPGGNRVRPPPQDYEWFHNLRPMIWRNLERLSIFANHRISKGTTGTGSTSQPPFDFLGEGDNRRSAVPAPHPILNADLSLAGLSNFGLVTANDNRLFRMGPGNRVALDAESLAQLSVQSRTAALILTHVIQNPELIPQYVENTPWCMDVEGVVVKQDVRAGPFPKLPVPNSIVVMKNKLVHRGSTGSDSIHGSVFSTRYELADSRGFFRFSGVPGAATGKGNLEVFKLHPHNGMLAYAPDSAMSSRGGYETSFGQLERDIYKRLVVFEGACVQLFEALDPMLLQPLARPGDSSIQLQEGRGGAFDKYSIFSPPQPSVMLVALVPPNSSLKVIVPLSGFGNRMMLLKADADHPTGQGYEVGEGISLTRTSALAAEDLWALNDARLKKLSRKGVRSTVAQRLHEKATADRARLEAAKQANQHALARYIARNVWGRELNAYPAILKTTNQAVVAAIILLAFLAPWALFMERVFLQSGSILWRITGAVGFFTAAFALIYWLHPAFQISQTPIMILVAYTLATLAALALSVIVTRYSSLMKRWRESVGGIHQSDISRAGAFAVAFNLGLSNMAKRRLRTVLTIAMIALLSFSVMTFTSIQPFLGLRKTPLPTVDNVKYDGVLFRLYNWGRIDESTAASFVADLGSDVEAVERYWHNQEIKGAVPGPGGEGSQSLFTRVTDDARPPSTVVNCLLGFSPREPDFSDLDDCVTGAWFSGGRDEVILPARAAEALGITTDDVVNRAPDEQVKVRFGSKQLRVIGILDSERADKLHGLGGTPLSHIDRFLSGVGAGQSANENAKALTLPVGDELNAKWVPFANCALLPGILIKTLQGSIATVAARFPEGTDAGERIDEVMSRFAMNLYASIDGKPYLIKSTTSQSVSGVWKILLPLLLVVLIMVNLMLGTVDERQEEIKMLGAVGLAPRHVTVLYLAESCCLGVMGLVFGVLLGLGVSCITRGMDVGVNVNYASVPTMLMGITVLLVVVVSTLIPAARAARMATPSGAEEWKLPDSKDGRVRITLPFTMTRENGVGIFAFLHEYMDGHWDSTSADFRCAALDTTVEPAGTDNTEMVIASRIWLAPYDMRVSQRSELRLGTDNGELFRVSYIAQHLSGELGTWANANFTFVDLLRQQFLIYRTLSDDQRQGYVERAETLFGQDQGTSA